MGISIPLLSLYLTLVSFSFFIYSMKSFILLKGVINDKTVEIRGGKDYELMDYWYEIKKDFICLLFYKKPNFRYYKREVRDEEMRYPCTLRLQ